MSLPDVISRSNSSESTPRLAQEKLSTTSPLPPTPWPWVLVSANCPGHIVTRIHNATALVQALAFFEAEGSLVVQCSLKTGMASYTDRLDVVRCLWFVALLCEMGLLLCLGKRAVQSACAATMRVRRAGGGWLGSGGRPAQDAFGISGLLGRLAGARVPSLASPSRPRGYGVSSQRSSSSCTYCRGTL